MILVKKLLPVINGKVRNCSESWAPASLLQALGWARGYRREVEVCGHHLLHWMTPTWWRRQVSERGILCSPFQLNPKPSVILGTFLVLLGAVASLGISQGPWWIGLGDWRAARIPYPSTTLCCLTWSHPLHKPFPPQDDYSWALRAVNPLVSLLPKRSEILLAVHEDLFLCGGRWPCTKIPKDFVLPVPVSHFMLSS